MSFLLKVVISISSKHERHIKGSPQIADCRVLFMLFTCFIVSESDNAYRRGNYSNAFVKDSADCKYVYIIYQYHAGRKQNTVFKNLRISKR